MKVKKMLDKLKDILSAERQAQLAKYDSLKKVLKSLKDERTRLKTKLAHAAGDNERQEITNRLKIISKQRKKGKKVLGELKKERK